MREITLNSIVKRREDLIAQDLDDAVVMAKQDTGDYFGMQLVAKRVWELLERPGTVRAICATLRTEYDVDPATCEREVLEFMNDLMHDALIQASE